MRCVTLIFLAALIAAGVSAQSVPSTINYQGRLTDNTPQQTPLDGPVTVRFDIYDAASGGTSLWNETDTVTVAGGIFSVLLGSGTSIPPGPFTSGANRYLQLTVNPAGAAEILSPRQQITATGYANQAALATTATSATTADVATSAFNSSALGGISAGSYQAATNVTCPGGSFLTAISSLGASTNCTAPPANNLVPPVFLFGATGSPILTVSNTDTGAAGNFSINNAADGQDALASATNGPGRAFFASTSGAGRVGEFISSNPSNTDSALRASTAGTGSALTAISNGTGGSFFSYGGPSYRGIQVQQNGTGVGAEILVSGAANSSHAIEVTTFGTGAAGYFSQSNSASASNAVEMYHGGSGSTLYAQNSGTGFVANFQQSNASAGAAALYASTAGSGDAIGGLASGTGSAGSFSQNNPGSSASALNARTSGNGTALALSTTNPASRLLGLTAAAGQTANLAEWRASAGTLLGYLDNVGGIHETGAGAGISLLRTSAGNAASFSNGDSSPALTAFNSGSGPAGQFQTNGAGPALSAVATTAGSVSFQATANGASVIPVVVSGSAGQSVDLQDWRNSAGTTLAWVDSLGRFHGNGASITNVTANALGLPYSGTDAGVSAYSFTLLKSGSAGGAGLFRIVNAANTSIALAGMNQGQGEAGDFSLTDTGNGSDALHATTAGTGNAVYASKLGTTGGGVGVRAIAVSQNAIYASSTSAYGILAESASGSGVVGSNLNSGDSGAVGGPDFGVSGSAAGIGHSGVIGTANSGATGVAGTVAASASGTAGSFVNKNAGNALPALSVTTSSPTAALSLTGAGATGTALAIQAGSIQVTGAGDGTSTPVFIHQATAPSANSTCINHPLTNNDPGAILIVTQNTNPPSNPGVINGHPVGVAYVGGGWCIINLDNAAMPLNAAFNVLVIKP